MPGFHEYEKHDSEFNSLYKKSILDKIKENMCKTRIENILKKAKDAGINFFGRNKT